MNRSISIIAACALLVPLCSCATIAGRAVSVEAAKHEIPGYNGIYPGARLAFDVYFAPEDLGDDIDTLPNIVRAPLMIVALIDLPLSFSIDTLLFPFDAIAWFTTPAPVEEEPRQG